MAAADDKFLGEAWPVGALGRVGLGLAALGRPGYINLGHADDTPDKSVDGMHEVRSVAYTSCVTATKLQANVQT